MKKFIYIFGIVLLNVFSFGAIFKVQHWPGANILFVVGIGLFALVFMPMAFINSYRGSSDKSLWLYITGFICAFICTVGALFKVLHLPGANWFLIIGVPLPFVFFLPVYLYHQKKTKEKSVLNFLGVMFLLIYISVFSALLSLNVSKDVLFSLTINSCDLANTNEVLSSQVDDLLDLRIKPCDSLFFESEKAKMVKAKSDAIVKLINDIEKELIIEAEGGKNLAIDNDKINFRAIAAKDETSSTTKIMRGDDGASGRGLELKKAFNNYRQQLDSLSKKKNATIEELLSTGDITENKYGEAQLISWEDSFFANGTFLIAILGNLECLKTRVLLAESEVINLIQ